MRHAIYLFCDSRSWLAKHTDPAIQELFGTDTLPTAFTYLACPSEVKGELERLNPACDVHIGVPASLR